MDQPGCVKLSELFSDSEKAVEAWFKREMAAIAEKRNELDISESLLRKDRARQIRKLQGTRERFRIEEDIRI